MQARRDNQDIVRMRSELQRLAMAGALLALAAGAALAADADAFVNGTVKDCVENDVEIFGGLNC